jgi:hypothetical protein
MRALEDLDGFSSRLEPDRYFHVHVEADSFDEAQHRLRDVLTELDEGVTIPLLVQRRAEGDAG